MMETSLFPATDEQVKQVVRRWIDLLAADQYSKACEMLYQGNINPHWEDRTRSDKRWTPELLKKVIGNYGMFEPYHEGVYQCRVVPVTEALRLEFETFLSVQEFCCTPADEVGLRA